MKRLRGKDLSHKNWSEKNLRCADLRMADLSFTDLSYADLTRADLGKAILTRANLVGASLRGAYLRGAHLTDIKVNWKSHDLVAEILFREARDDYEKMQFAGLILIARDWCWDDFLFHPQVPWAVRVLKKWVRPGDNAPDILK